MYMCDYRSFMECCALLRDLYSVSQYPPILVDTCTLHYFREQAQALLVECVYCTLQWSNGTVVGQHVHELSCMKTLL